MQIRTSQYNGGNTSSYVVKPGLQLEESAVAEQEQEGDSFREVLNATIDTHPDLVKGKLDNGLEYVILPNAKPPQRFEAHLEVHAGEALPSLHCCTFHVLACHRKLRLCT